MSAANFLKSIVPAPLWPKVKDLGFDVIEFSDRLIRSKNNLVPPPSIQYVGDKDKFFSVGKEFLELFQTLGHLKPEHTVLDIGCGTGRMAYPLTKYLSKAGSYQGFDIVPHAVQWCKRRYEHQFANFHFYLADIRNRDYNPTGATKAENYRFAHADASFDFAFATSVFTHMLPAEAQNYLSEIRRVLRPTGYGLLTFFVMNEKAKTQVENQRGMIPLKHKMDGYYTSDMQCPELAVGFAEETLATMLREAGLKLEGNIHYGNWCGRDSYLSFQDVLVVRPVN